MLLAAYCRVPLSNTKCNLNLCVFQLALWLRWQSACLVNRRSWVRIPAGPFNGDPANACTHYMNICTYYLEFDVDAIIHTRKHRMTNDYCHYIPSCICFTCKTNRCEPRCLLWGNRLLNPDSDSWLRGLVG